MRSNVLLVELLVVILFFSLSSVVTLNLFVTAHEKSADATACDKALTVVEDWAERLAAEDRPDEALYREGWTATEEGYTLKQDAFTLLAVVEREVREAGVLFKTTLSAQDEDGNTFFKIRADRYVAEVGA